MRSLDWVKQAVRDSSELSKQGENAGALKLLDQSIQRALDSNNAPALRILCRHASVIADATGNLQQAQRYCELLAGLEQP